MPTISSDIWITKEGKQLEIRTMASSHLLSTIHFIERNRFTQTMECAMREPSNINEQQWEDNPLQYYLQWPIQYENLVAEAQRRGLIYRASEGVTRKRLKP